MKIEPIFVSTFLFSKLVKTSRVSSNQWNARCPFCLDSKKNLSKKRFYVTYKNESSILYHCFNCNVSGNFLQLYAFIEGIDEREAYKRIRGNSLDSLKKSFDSKTQVEDKVDNALEDVSWILEDCVKDGSESLVSKELLKKLDEFRIERRIFSYPLFVAYQGKYKNRIVIPVYQDGIMVYFQARAIGSLMPKYLNPRVPKESIIFNSHIWDKSKPVVICEGLFDAISIGNQGTCCFGSSISKDFLSNVPNAIIALDNDETGKKEMLKLTKMHPHLKFCIFGDSEHDCKDMNDLLKKGIEPYSYVLEHSYDSLKAQVLLKIGK